MNVWLKFSIGFRNISFDLTDINSNIEYLKNIGDERIEIQEIDTGTVLPPHFIFGSHNAKISEKQFRYGCKIREDKFLFNRKLIVQKIGNKSKTVIQLNRLEDIDRNTIELIIEDKKFNILNIYDKWIAIGIDNNILDLNGVKITFEKDNIKIVFDIG